MNGGEDLRLFDPDGRQMVDIKKPPVVNLVRGHSPIAQTVSLVCQQGLEGVETPWVAPLTVHECDHLLDRLTHGRAELCESCQAPFRDLLLALTNAHSLRISIAALRQELQRGDDALELDHVRIFSAEFDPYPLAGRLQDGYGGPRRDRETPLVVGD